MYCFTPNQYFYSSLIQLVAFLSSPSHTRAQCIFIVQQSKLDIVYDA